MVQHPQKMTLKLPPLRRPSLIFSARNNPKTSKRFRGHPELQVQYSRLVCRIREKSTPARRKKGSQPMELVLCQLHERVLSVFQIARLDGVFDIVATVDDALTA